MTDNRTLDEVKADDRDQAERVFREAKRYEFLGDRPRARARAYKFQGECVRWAMESLGVLITKHSDPAIIDRQLKAKGVTIEKRRYHEAKDVWDTGVYIYKEDGELAYFISEVKENHPSPFAINRIQKWAVVTNVPVPGAKKFFSIHGMTAMGGRGSADVSSPYRHI